MNREIIDILVCPATHQSLRMASKSEMAKIQKRYQESGLTRADRQPVEEMPDSLLIREDEKVAYLVIDQIPNLMVNEGILLP